jgi:hypothetical protein
MSISSSLYFSTSIKKATAGLALILASGSILAADYKIEFGDLAPNGKLGVVYADNPNIFASEGRCKSVTRQPFCVYADFCNVRYWVPKGLAKSIGDHASKKGKGINIVKNNRRICVAGKR